MKKYLFTSAILLFVLTESRSQNYNAGPLYIGTPVYDASTSNGSQQISGSNLVVATGGTWMFNDAVFTTPRSGTSQTELVQFKGGSYNRSSGFINGYAATENQATGFVLPIGNSGYMPLTINTALASGSPLTAAWSDVKPRNNVWLDEPGGGAGAQYDFLPGYYDLKTSGSGISVKPTVPAAATSSTHLLGTVDGNTFTDLGLATANATLPAGVYQLRFANKGVILPLTITSFTANKQGSTGMLAWKVSSEQNIVTYTVERSADSRSFTTLGVIASVGNGNQERTYTLPDAQPLKGANYYRVKITEKDGKTSFTPLRLLNFDGIIRIAVFPNPAAEHITLTGIEAGMQIRLISKAGQLVSLQQASGTTVQIDVQRLLSATYEVQVYDTNGKLIANSHIVKQ